MLANVTGADCAEQCVRNCMGEDVGIRVAGQAARVRDFDPAENELSIFGETMYVIANAAAGCPHNFKSIMPFEAMMLYLSFISLRGRRSTVPPAVSIKIQPAAMSHKLMPCSM